MDDNDIMPVKSFLRHSTQPRLMHPGAVFWFQYMQPLGISLRTATFGVLGYTRLDDTRRFLGGFIDVDAGLAARLAAATETTPEYWLEIQRMYDEERGR